MEYYGHNDWRDYHLAHSGVKGMEWGKHLPGTEWLKNGMNNPQAAAMQNLNASIQNAAAARNPGPTINTQTPTKLGVPAKIQQEIGQQQAASSKNQDKSNSESSNKSSEDIDKMADSVINGKYGNGEARKKALEEAGYNWAEVQNKVNEKLGSSVRHALDEIGNKSVNDSSTKSSASAGKNALDSIRNAEGHGAKVTNSSSSKSKKKSDKEKRKEAAESRQEIRSRKNKTTRFNVNDSRKDNAAAKRRAIRSRLNNTLYNGEDGVIY